MDRAVQQNQYSQFMLLLSTKVWGGVIHIDIKHIIIDKWNLVPLNIDIHKK